MAVEGWVELVQGMDVLISAVVAISVVFLSGYNQKRIRRGRHRTALTTEVEHMPFEELHDDIVLRKHPDEDISKIKPLLEQPDSYDEEDLKARRGSNRYYNVYLRFYDKSFPTTVYDAVVGDIEFDKQELKVIINFYSHVKEGSSLFAPSTIRMVADLEETEPLEAVGDSEHLVAMAEVFANRGIELKKELLRQLDP